MPKVDKSRIQEEERRKQNTGNRIRECQDRKHQGQDKEHEIRKRRKVQGKR
jgi:hypothetical protein